MCMYTIDWRPVLRFGPCFFSIYCELSQEMASLWLFSFPFQAVQPCTSLPPSPLGFSRVRVSAKDRKILIDLEEKQVDEYES